MKNKITSIIYLIFFVGITQNSSAQSDTFHYVSDTIQTWTVPSCVTQITVELWAGGGGGGNWENEVYPYEHDTGIAGGSGAYYEGVISGLTQGTLLDLYVPSGGKFYDTSGVAGVGGVGGWPGGGQGGNDPYVLNLKEIGGGGGRLCCNSNK